LIDIKLAATFRFFFDGVLRLAFGPDEHEARAIHPLLSYELYRFLEEPLGLLKINDVNSVSLAEDKLLHLRIPTPDLMSEVDASFKQFLHRYCYQSILLHYELVYVLTGPRSNIVLLEQPIARTGNGIGPRSKVQGPKSKARSPKPDLGLWTWDLGLVYRFENWKRLRAPFWPYFLRSFARGSRVTKPAFFNLILNSGFMSTSARVIP